HRCKFRRTETCSTDPQDSPRRAASTGQPHEDPHGPGPSTSGPLGSRHEEVDRMMHGRSPTPSTPVGRRSVLKGAGGLGALAGLGALSGCAGAEARASDDVAFWHLLSGPDGVTMGEMLDGYMAAD